MSLTEKIQDLCWWLQINTMGELERFKKEYKLEKSTDAELVEALENEFNEVWGC